MTKIESPGLWCALSAAVMVQKGESGVPGPVGEQVPLELFTNHPTPGGGGGDTCTGTEAVPVRLFASVTVSVAVQLPAAYVWSPWCRAAGRRWSRHRSRRCRKRG